MKTNKTDQPKTLTHKEALKQLIKLSNFTLKRLEEKEMLEATVDSLGESNDKLSDAIDELCSYSSIKRIAKFNQCPETKFRWQTLNIASEKLGLKIEQIPCPRGQTKNLYHHDAWRLAYPGFKLPETTTLRIVQPNS